MGVATNADDRRDSAVVHIEGAIDDLQEVVVKECWGWDDFNPEYKGKLIAALTSLLVIKQDLKR